MGLSLRLEVEDRALITSIPRSLSPFVGHFGNGLFSDGLWSSMMPRRGPAMANLDVMHSYARVLANSRFRLLLALVHQILGPRPQEIDLDSGMLAEVVNIKNVANAMVTDGGPTGKMRTIMLRTTCVLCSPTQLRRSSDAAPTQLCSMTQLPEVNR